MDNNSIHTTVPQLRFPDFANEREWEETKVGDVINTLTPPKKLNSSEYEKTGKYPIIDQSQNFICGYSDDEDALMNHNNEDLIVFGDHTCVLKFVNFPFIQGADGIKIIKSKDSNKLIESFLFQSLLNNPVVSREYKRHFSELKEKEFCFPHSIVEQQKIASCLFSMDAYISSTKEKLELLKIYKKGLMQKLFPAKGKQRPELRFKEFEKDGEWEEKKLGEIISVNSGRDYKHLNYGSIPVYGTGGYMLSVDDKLSNIDAVGIGRKGTIDKPQYLKAPFWTVDTLFFLTNRDGYVIQFIYYLTQTVPWKKYGEQTGVPSLSKLSIENLDVVVPPTILEQRKIAQTILPLDEELDSLSKKIELLGKQKKGLMQQLFIY